MRHLAMHLNMISTANDAQKQAWSVCVKSADEMLEISSHVGGTVSRFPFIWLRDNCLCQDCFHSASSSRLTSFKNLDPSEVLLNAELCIFEVGAHRLGRTPDLLTTPQTSECVRCHWSSGHVSHFPVKYLMDRCFSQEARQKRKASMEDFLCLRIAGSEEQQPDTMPIFQLHQMLEDDRVMLKWCQKMRQFGCALVKTDNRPHTLKRLTDVFGFREWSSFGEYFEVEVRRTKSDSPTSSNTDANNLAYTGLPLEFHTDLPHYASPPQVQFLHCISQSSVGGSNKLVDGFRVAERIREHHPEAFRLLTTVQMEYKDFNSEVLWDSGPGGDNPTNRVEEPRVGTRREVEFFMRQKHPIIVLDAAGKITRINYSDHHRDAILDIDVEQVKPFYQACMLFDDLLNHEDFMFLHKSSPGDIICFDNKRVLHAREAFEVKEGESRKLNATYVRWDEIMSLARIIACRISPDVLI
jgi:gamma-butyrobetaine dioxygenase